jgi:hypothetical protein
LTRAGEEKGVLEVGDGVDTRAPLVSQQTKKKRGRGRGGPVARLDGPRGLAGPRAGKKGKGRERDLESFLSFFSNLFKLLNLNSFSNFKLLQNFSRFKLFSKIFKSI